MHVKILLVLTLFVLCFLFPSSKNAFISSVIAAPESSLPWASGVHTANELQPHLAFGTWRGNPIDMLVSAFTTRNGGWGPIINPINIFDALGYQNYKGIFVLSQPLFPDDGSLSACASGQYNNNWSQFGTFLTQRNRNEPTMIIRLAWEFNGNWYKHSATNVSEFVTCYKNVVTAIKSTAPNILIDWTFNAHHSQECEGNAFQCYPGDEYVDIVGIDNYDHYPPARNEAEWQKQCTSEGQGLCDIIAFAREHGKPFSVPEWGVAIGSDNGGGDNSFYIQKMFDTFVENKDILAYESYYNAPLSLEPDNVGSGIFPNLGSVDAPQASAKYKELFGTNSPAAGIGGGYTLGEGVAVNDAGTTPMLTPTLTLTPTPTSIPLPYYPTISPWVFIIPGIIIFLAVILQ